MKNVVVVKGENASNMAYEAMEKVYKPDSNNKSVLLKVNTGFKGPQGTGLCTHPETVRGAIRFFKEQSFDKIYVGDSSITGVDNWEALKAAGIFDLCEEMEVTCVNLDEADMVKVDIPDGVIVKELKFSSLVFDVDVVVSMPVMKTHMYTGATLSIKNMKGAMHKLNKTVLHRILTPSPDPEKGRVLDFGIAEMARICYPDYALIDGFVAMEGFGPSGGTSKELGVVLASNEPIACDLVAIRLMGMAWDDISHLNIIAEEKSISVEDINVEPENYMDYAQKFKLASEKELMESYSNITIIDKGACSGCHATMIAFLKVHGEKISKDRDVRIYLGKDLKDEDFEGDFNKKECFLIGNCTARYKDSYGFCKGCPPIPSKINDTVNG
jgi:uncharacterized protein (DUF362 family)